MNPYDMNESSTRRSNILRHAGFRVGFLAAIFTSLLHLLLPLFAGGRAWGDGLAWVLQWLIYILAARSAAQQHYRSQEQTLEALRGVQGAGVGAALVASLLTWLFIICRAVVLDATEAAIVIVEPISLYCIVVIDVLVAMALGAWGGQTVVREHRTFQDY